jgi:hypothetical protein
MKKLINVGGFIRNLLILIVLFFLSFTNIEEIRLTENEEMISQHKVSPKIPMASPKNDHIQPWSENPRYWQYKGEPVLLLGGTDDDNLFQWNIEALREQLDLLKSVGGNYVRNTMSDRRVTPESHPHLVGKLETSSAFLQLDNGKYDLNQWDEEYFNRLTRFLNETARRDIIVQIELWDGQDFIDRPHRQPWEVHPFNPANNINYTAEETTIPEEWEISYRERIHPLHLTVPGLNDDSIVNRYMQAFMRKVLSVTLDYDHVIYVIQNESWSPDYWSKYWAGFVHERAEERGKSVYVADMRFTPSVEPVFDGQFFNFADISQSAGRQGEFHYKVIRRNWEALSDQPCPLNSVKQYGGETSWTHSAEEGKRRVWRSVFSGQAAVRFHRPPEGIGLTPQAQANLMSLRELTNAINIFQCLPHQKVAELLFDREPDEAYLLADPGRVYAVFFPGGGQVDLDISAVGNAVIVRWLEIGATRWLEPEHMEMPRITLEAPGPGLWAVVIVPAD